MDYINIVEPITEKELDAILTAPREAHQSPRQPAAEPLSAEAMGVLDGLLCDLDALDADAMFRRLRKAPTDAGAGYCDCGGSGEPMRKCTRRD